LNDLVKVARALAEPTRVRILLGLRAGELCVCELSDALDVTQSTLSTHLQVIREAGLVSARRSGKWMYYALHPEARPRLEAIFETFHDALESDPALQLDRQMLAGRLCLREGEACCVGPSAEKPLASAQIPCGTDSSPSMPPSPSAKASRVRNGVSASRGTGKRAAESVTSVISATSGGLRS
jgi:ArsR family transcriptional regulator